MRSFHVLLWLALLAGMTGVLQAGLIDPDYAKNPMKSGRPVDLTLPIGVSAPMPGYDAPPGEDKVPNNIKMDYTLNKDTSQNPYFYFDTQFKVNNISKGTTEYLFTVHVTNKTGYKLTLYEFLLGYGLGKDPLTGDPFKNSNDRDYLDFHQPFDPGKKVPTPRPTSTVFKDPSDLDAGRVADYLKWTQKTGAMPEEAVADGKDVTFTFPVNIPNASTNHQMPDSALTFDSDGRINGYYFTLRATFNAPPPGDGGQASSNPEPASVLLLGIGLIAMGGLVYYSRQREKRLAQN